MLGHYLIKPSRFKQLQFFCLFAFVLLFFEVQQKAHAESTAFPDSTLLRRLEENSNKRIIVTLKNGKTIKGKFKIREDGIEMVGRTNPPLIEATGHRKVIQWEEIGYIQFVDTRKINLRLWYIGTAAFIVIGSFILLNSAW